MVLKGTGRLSYVITPLAAIQNRVAQDGTLVQYILNNTAAVGFCLFSSYFPSPYLEKRRVHRTPGYRTNASNYLVEVSVLYQTSLENQKYYHC